MKRWIHAATTPEIIDNNQIQVGLKWFSDGFTYEITDVSPDHKTCTMKETWINKDNGEPMKEIHECKIAQDENGQEFCYDVNYKEYAFNENDPEGYGWWARKYATSADNYPFDYGSTTNKYSGYEDDEEYSDEDDYEPHDYGPGNPWDAPGMSVRDFI